MSKTWRSYVVPLLLCVVVASSSSIYAEEPEKGRPGVLDTQAELEDRVSTIAFGNGVRGMSDSMTWQIETVDSSDSICREPALAFDASDHPHIAYRDVTNSKLKYAFRDVSGWYSETLPSALFFDYTNPDLAVDQANTPHISFYDSTGHDVYYWKRGDSVWDHDSVHKVDNDTREVSSLQLDVGDRPHIGYLHPDSPRYAWQQPDGTWAVESVGEGLVDFSSFALDPSDQPRMSYSVWDSGLWYAFRDASGWHTEHIYSADYIFAVSLAVDSSHYPHVGFFDDHPGMGIKYAYYDASGWHFETVDTEGRDVSLAIGTDDRAHVTYRRDTGELLYAYRDAAGWHPEIVDAVSGVDPASIAVDSAGNPHISYNADGDIKHAIGTYSPPGPWFDIPVWIQRKAAQHVEEMRNTDMAPEWDSTARLEWPVRPLYRPDVDEVAYYEFPVVIGEEDGQPGATSSENSGFVIVSAGEHDFPIPHWASGGDSPSRQMEQLALEQGQTAVKFYKIDSLGYAAENSSGELVANLGALPPKITGIDPAWAEQEPGLHEATWTLNEPVDDDENVEGIEGTLVVTGTTSPPSLEFGAWDSWDDLKTHYVDSYQGLLASLQNVATPAWEAENTIREWGEVLKESDVYQMALLGENGTAALSGEGLQHVDVTELSPPGGPPVLQITVVSTPEQEGVPLFIEVTYENGVSETVIFLIVDPFYTDCNKVYLPLVVRDGHVGATELTAGSPTVQGWFQWYYVKAASGGNLPYDQLDPHDPPNDKGYYSGCGSTAWAMLFAWVDTQSWNKNWYWKKRTGGYRKKDGPFYCNTGTDPTHPSWDCAPPTTFTWEAKNWLWKIRSFVPTFHNGFGEGAVLPDLMCRGSRFLEGRTATRTACLGIDKHWLIAFSPQYYAVYSVWLLSILDDMAKDSIRERETPAIIGTGFYTHYPMAHSYHYRTRKVCKGWWYFKVCWDQTEAQFGVNWGAGNAATQWVSDNIWFVGEVYPR